MTTNTVSQAVEQRDQGPNALVDYYGPIFGNVLPQHVTQKAFVRKLQGLLRRNDKLRQVATKNFESFLAASLDCARLGLDPGETYHFVPFGNEITGIPDYTGEIELIYRAGAVSSVKAQVVHAKDEFHFTPDMDRPRHVVDWFADDRGDMVGVYAYAVMKDGATSRVVMMNRREVEQVKAVSKSAKQADSPWQRWPDRMWLKTAIHQLQKWVPTSAEYLQHQLRAAVEADNARSQPVPQMPEQPPAGVDAGTGEIHDAELVDDGWDDEAARAEAAAEAQQ